MTRQLPVAAAGFVLVSMTCAVIASIAIATGVQSPTPTPTPEKSQRFYIERSDILGQFQTAFVVRDTQEQRCVLVIESKFSQPVITSQPVACSH